MNFTSFKFESFQILTLKHASLIHRVFFLKFLYATRRIHDFLTAREKRMASRANIYAKLRFVAFSGESIAASASYFAFYKFRVYIFFHRFSLINLKISFDFSKFKFKSSLI